MDNFKVVVPADLQAKIKDLAYLVDFSELVTRRVEAHSYQKIHEIEGNYRDGWMPRQDGGFSVEQFFMNDTDSSYHFTEKQTEFNQDQSEQCFKAFLHDNGIDSETNYVDLSDDQKEELSQYEMDWFDSALLQLQIFVDGFTEWKGDDKQVTIRLSINYKDAPYYREGDAEDIKVLSLEIDEFMSMDNEEILKQFII